MKPLKTPITRIDYIEDSYSLILQSDTSLYFYDTGLKQLTEIYKGISYFAIERDTERRSFKIYISSKRKIKMCLIDEFLKNKNIRNIEFNTILT